MSLEGVEGFRNECGFALLKKKEKKKRKSREREEERKGKGRKKREGEERGNKPRRSAKVSPPSHMFITNQTERGKKIPTKNKKKKKNQ